MNTRERRAAREFRGYLERLYGPQQHLVLGHVEGLGVLRVHLAVSGVSAPRPEGETNSAASTDRHAPAYVALVARLAAQLVAIRSERYTPAGGLVPVACADGEEDLAEAFGPLFPAGTIELDVPWQEVLRAGADILLADGLIDGLNTTQAKSKFASLRWYYRNDSKIRRAEVNTTISALEYLSTVVCETCGAPGVHRPGGWHVVACDSCQQERERKRRKRGG